MRRYLQGEHPVTVTARIDSGKRARYCERAERRYFRMTIEGRMLDYMIQNYLLPYYPDAKVGTAVRTEP